MKNQQPGKNNADSLKIKGYPQCMNKKEARMVCLNEGCHQYAFFCLQCQDQSCEKIHRHINKADKFQAISFKQFIRRVLKQRKPIEQLQSSMNTYKQTLQRLRKDVNEFVQKQLKNLIEIINKVTDVPADLAVNIKKLKEQQYAGLKGLEMDYLWKNCGESQQVHRMQVQTADFIKIKEEELKAISEHFQNLNKIQIDRIDDSDLQLNTIQSKGKNNNGAKSPPLASGVSKKVEPTSKKN